jgi:fatty-acid desaturase
MKAVAQADRKKTEDFRMNNETTIKKQAKGINWHTATFIALFHVGAVAALFMFSWRALVVAIVFWWITASLGVGMGFHILLTHCSMRGGFNGSRG